MASKKTLGKFNPPNPPGYNSGYRSLRWNIHHDLHFRKFVDKNCEYCNESIDHIRLEYGLLSMDEKLFDRLWHENNVLFERLLNEIRG